MRSSKAFLYATFARAFLAIGLGLALLFQSDKRLPILVNFMGMYWLLGGLIGLRWGLGQGRIASLPVIAGAIGILAGLLALVQRWLRLFIAPDTVAYMLGAVILLTGMLHVLSGFRRSETQARFWSLTSLLLGTMEIVLGVLLLFYPVERGTALYYAAAIWALLGGLVLTGDALRIRRKLEK